MGSSHAGLNGTALRSLVVVELLLEFYRRTVVLADPWDMTRWRQTYPVWRGYKADQSE
jgi:hypothetical protein